jgi:peptidoglycan/LPS O-acetylase OafA/YrhL
VVATLFAVIGIAVTAVRMKQRKWFLAVASFLGPCSAELALAANTYHHRWLGLTALAVALTGGGLALVGQRRETRAANGQQPG